MKEAVQIGCVRVCVWGKYIDHSGLSRCFVHGRRGRGTAACSQPGLHHLCRKGGAGMTPQKRACCGEWVQYLCPTPTCFQKFEGTGSQ